MAKQLGEPLDSRIPESFIAAKPVVGAREGPGVDSAVVNSPAHGALDQAGPLEGLDVLRRRGEGHAVRRRKLAHGLLAFRESLQHPAPGVIGKCAENQIKSCPTMFNHMVEYIRHPPGVNSVLSTSSLVDSVHCWHVSSKEERT